MEIEYCVDEWATPPEGVPTWCVKEEVTWELGAQLFIELVILFIGIIILRRYIQAKRLREYHKQHAEGLSKSSYQTTSWPHSSSTQEKVE
jgi:hypothetical protein